MDEDGEPDEPEPVGPSSSSQVFDAKRAELAGGTLMRSLMVKGAAAAASRRNKIVPEESAEEGTSKSLLTCTPAMFEFEFVETRDAPVTTCEASVQVSDCWGIVPLMQILGSAGRQGSFPVRPGKSFQTGACRFAPYPPGIMYLCPGHDSCTGAETGIKRPADEEELPPTVGHLAARGDGPAKKGRHSRPMELVLQENLDLFRKGTSLLYTDQERRKVIIRSIKWYASTQRSNRARPRGHVGRWCLGRPRFCDFRMLQLVSHCFCLAVDCRPGLAAIGKEW